MALWPIKALRRLPVNEVRGHGGEQAQLTQWMGSLLIGQESVRTVDLPALPDVKEHELGSMVVGDWSVPQDGGTLS